MTQYSSKDFGKTKREPEVQVPDRLIHPNVTGDAEETSFSRERKHAVFVVDLPSKTLSLTIGGLEPGQTTGRHRHTYETILYVLEGEGRTVIEDRVVEWKAGDAVYIPVWAWHHHENRSDVRPCRYVACENAPMLQNLGVALREER
jgi:quercetin dioxygenase-like cupin family protein